MAMAAQTTKRQKRQLERGRITFKNNLPYRCLKFKGLAKVAVRKCQKIVGILRVQRLIQSQRVAKLRNLSGSGAFSQHLFHRIAGYNVNHQEDQGQHQPERRQRHQKALRM